MLRISPLYRKIEKQVKDARWFEAHRSRDAQRIAILDRLQACRIEGRQSLSAKREPTLVPVPSSAKRIVYDVAKEHGLTLAHVLGGGRHAALYAVRQEAMYRVVRDTSLSYPMIGKVFGRDHSTIIHGVENYCRDKGLAHPRRPREENING